MKIISITIILFLLLPLTSLGQAKSKILRIYSITEYIRGYVIKAVDTINYDTLSLSSVKERIINKEGYIELLVGKEYNFKYDDYLSSSVAVGSFVIRMGNEVIWRNGDSTRSRPIKALNVKGLWIEK